MKVIIHNQSKLSDEEAVEKVYWIMRKGRISTSIHGPQYCAVSVWGNTAVVLCSKRSRSTDTFYVNDHNP